MHPAVKAAALVGLGVDVDFVALLQFGAPVLVRRAQFSEFLIGDLVVEPVKHAVELEEINHGSVEGVTVSLLLKLECEKSDKNFKHLSDNFQILKTSKI